jgi:GntR family transcriptional regulator, transcriptional repressor for pyruvate dehydrogenase complex
MAATAHEFSAIRPTRASSDVIAQIRQAIFSGRFQPGDRLPTEREMAQQFGVSRVTVRDALRALETNGLIRVKVGGQGGPYVAEPDVSLLSDSLGTHLQLRGTTFRELAEARLALETTAARLAAERATDQDLVALQAAILGPLRPPDAGPTPAPAGTGTAAISLDFHTALVTAAHNRALLAMFSATRALIQEAFDALHAQQPDMAEAARVAHGELYRAIAARDAEASVRIMREHLYDFAARAERARDTPLDGAGPPRFS